MFSVGPLVLNQLSTISLAGGSSETDENETPALCIVGDSSVKLWGMTPAERLMRAFARHGITRVVGMDDLHKSTGPVIVVRGDAVLDAPLVTVIESQPGLVLLADRTDNEVPIAAHAVDGEAAVIAAAHLRDSSCTSQLAGFEARRPEALEANFWKALRKREIPYAMVVDETNRKEVEWRVFMGTYKGATDFVTKYLWPRPAFVTTRLLAPLGITPNMVTTVSAVCVVAAYFQFLAGEWVLGLISAWMMTFLDTVDGKLARITLTSSKWGDIFDHGIDLIHPPFWYSAWAVAIMAGPHPLSPEEFWLCLSVILGGYILQRVMEGLAIKFFGLEIHIWRPIDTLFRQITARRNPNLVIMTLSVVVGRPDWGLLAVAAWTLICLVLHGYQLAQAGKASRKNGRLESWMNSQPPRQ